MRGLAGKLELTTEADCGSGGGSEIAQNAWRKAREPAQATSLWQTASPSRANAHLARKEGLSHRLLNPLPRTVNLHLTHGHILSSLLSRASSTVTLGRIDSLRSRATAID